MDQLLDALISGVPALLGAFAGAYCTRGQTRWTRAGTARDEARKLLPEIVSWRWGRSPANQEDPVATQVYDERLRTSLLAARVPSELVNGLRDALHEFRRHIRLGSGDGDEEVQWIENQYIDRLDGVVGEIHAWLGDADWRLRAGRRELMRSRGSNENKKAAKGALTRSLATRRRRLPSSIATGAVDQHERHGIQEPSGLPPAGRQPAALRPRQGSDLRS